MTQEFIRSIHSFSFEFRWGWRFHPIFGPGQQQERTDLENLCCMFNFDDCQWAIGINILSFYLLVCTWTIWCKTCVSRRKIYVSQIVPTIPRHFLEYFYFRSFPWNEETLIGYIAENVLAAIVVVTYLFLNGAILILLMSLTWILQSFSEMYRNTAKKIKSTDENGNNEEILRKLIDFQNMAREWVEPWIILTFENSCRRNECTFLQIFHSTYAGFQPVYYDSNDFPRALLSRFYFSNISGKRFYTTCNTLLLHSYTMYIILSVLSQLAT